MSVRLLVVTDEMEVGGTQTQIFHLLNNIDQSKFTPVLLFFRNRSHLVDLLESNGIRAVQIQKRGSIDPVFFLKLLAFLWREKFEVIHAFSFSAEMWTALASLVARPKKLITSIRGKYEWYTKTQWRIKRWVTRRSHSVVTNSRVAGEFAFKQMNLESKKLTVIRNGIDIPSLPDRQPEKNQQDGSVKPLVMTFCGRLVDHKNIPCLLKGFGRISENLGEDVQLVMIGDGPEREQTEALIRSLALNNVTLVGEHDDPLSIVSQCDVAVSTSIREGLSNAILEAMSLAIPVVASNVGGTPEIITHNVNGLLFSSDDEVQFADAAITLLRSRSERARIGAAARNDVSARFSIPGMVDSFQGHYQSEDEA